MQSDRVTQSIEMARWIESCLSSLSETSIGKDRLAASLYLVAMDHHAAMVRLCAEEYFPSARALVRCSFEAYVRGEFYGKAATLTELEAFTTGGDPPKLKTLIARVAAHEQRSTEATSRWEYVRAQHYEALCDFTHGGIEQLKQHVAEVGGEQWVTTPEFSNLMSIADVCALASLGQRALLSADVGIAELTRRKAAQLFELESTKKC